MKIPDHVDEMENREMRKAVHACKRPAIVHDCVLRERSHIVYVANYGLHSKIRLYKALVAGGFPIARQRLW